MDLGPRIVLVLGAGATIAVAAACKPSPIIEERMLLVHAPLSCPVSQREAYSVVYGNGDFDDSQSAVVSLFLDEVGKELTELPAATRSVIVDVSHPAQSVDWSGTAEVPPSGTIDVLVWPGGETCKLSRNVQPRTDAALGVFGHHLMVAGGSNPSQTPLTYVGDLSTGDVDKLEFGLGARRSNPTITAFRERPDEDPAPALVAGGEDPISRAPLGTAEIYVPKAGALAARGDFERVRIDLGEARTKHGAVVLATGETLLVGGLGQLGAPVTSMEIIDPKTRRNRTNGVAFLAYARVNPTVIRLASGEILVAGGLDRSNLPVAFIEWFSADASRATKRPVELVTGVERQFVPLEAGGALAVVRPPDGTTDFKSVWVISSDGSLEAGASVEFPPTSTASNGLVPVVRLFAGTEGAPVLWNGQRWLRWQPWFGAFQPIADAPPRGPSSMATASGDNGLALWLDDGADRVDTNERPLPLENQLYVRGYRFARRSRFGSVRNPLLADGTLGLAPDRLAGTAGSSIRFLADRGLELGPGASAFVTDVTYANVTVDLDGPDPASLVLRQEDGRELEVGGATCAFAQTAATAVRVERRGKNVSVSLDGGEARLCPTELDASARVAIGVRGAGGTGVTFARNLRISRR